MRWHESHRCDDPVRLLADRHYSRQSPGSKNFVQPGRCYVLKVPSVRGVAQPDGSAWAGWVTSWPFAQYVRHDWAGAWLNSFFRNESPFLSSDLIRQAVAATRAHYGEPPELGIVTMVEAERVRNKQTPGWSYINAGFEHVGFTKVKRQHVMQMMPGCMPMPKFAHAYTSCKPVLITLSAEELARGVEVHERRQAHARRKRYSDRHGAEQTDPAAIARGTLGELAVALWTGLPWCDFVDNPKPGMADVGFDIGVYTGTHLHIHPEDPDDYRHVLVRYRGGNTFALVGWAWGREIRAAVPFGNDYRGEAWRAPEKILRCMATFKP